MKPTKDCVDIIMYGKVVYRNLSVPDGDGGLMRLLRMLYYQSDGVIVNPDYVVYRRNYDYKPEY